MILVLLFFLACMHWIVFNFECFRFTLRKFE